MTYNVFSGTVNPTQPASVMEFGFTGSSMSVLTDGACARRLDR